jgi:uncharacterized protein YijF (DUF1287 family)
MPSLDCVLLPIIGLALALAVPVASSPPAIARPSREAPAPPRRAAVLLPRPTLRAPWPDPSTLPFDVETAVAARARLEVERGVEYDAGYVALASYPNGDVPADRGACSDLVVRALRAVGVDLQRLVHEDIQAYPSAYAAAPASLRLADANVDHRRVPTLYAYFERNTASLETDVRATAAFRAGDVVFYARAHCAPRPRCGPAHVAIVSDRVGARGLPLILQNGGPRASEDDALDHAPMLGHFRLTLVHLASGGAR